MASPLLELPRELRDRIYYFTLCTQGAAQIIHPDMRGEKMGFEGSPVRFPEKPEPRYPPGADVKVCDDHPKDHNPGTGDSSEDDLWENEEDSDGASVTEADLWGDDDLESDGEDASDSESYETLDREDDENGEGGSDDNNESFEDDASCTSEDYEQAMADFATHPLYRTADKAPTEYDVFEDDDLESDFGCDEDESDDEDKPRYQLEVFRPLDLAFLYTCKQIYEEAMPTFYANTTFIVDVPPREGLRFFGALPDRARERISSLVITGDALLTDDGGARWAWSGDADSPLIWDPAPMMTPFGAFMATKLPRLKHLYLYLPYGGGEDWYPDQAPRHAEVLLAKGCIERLSFVFLGSAVKKALRTCKDEDQCYSRLVGQLDDYAMETQLFDLEFPHGEELEFSESSDEYYAVRERARQVWTKKHNVWYTWEWVDRDIDMGSDGNVQAVCELEMMSESEIAEETKLRAEEKADAAASHQH